jgi:hypothetical protein
LKRPNLTRRQRAILLIVVIAASVLLAAKSLRQYHSWSSHADYFRLPEDQRQIESWMHISYIERTFDLELDEFLDDKLRFSHRRDSLDEICARKSLDCQELVNRLNQAAFPEREQP